MTRPNSPGLRISFGSALLALLLAAPASAATSELRILINVDVNPATGCAVTTVDGVFPGVEQILVTTVETSGTTGQVTLVERHECVDAATDTFGAAIPVSAGGWPVGVGLGVDGSDVVETFVGVSDIGGANPPPVIRLGVVGDNGREEDALLVVQPGGNRPILLTLVSALAIPTLSEWGLILMALLLATLALWRLRRLRRRSTVALLLLVCMGVTVVAWASVRDGLIDDWLGVSPLADDPQADAPLGADLRALFARAVGGEICFRLDVFLAFNRPPTAVDDDSTTDEDTILNVAAPGVLTNDSDPESDPLTVTAFDATSAQGAAVTVNADGSFSYDPTGAAALQALAQGDAVDDTFTYTIEDPDGGSDTATVTVTVDGVNDAPTAVGDSFVTDEDTTLNAPAPGVLANDTDPDTGDSLMAVLDTGPSNASSFTLNPDGSFDYTPVLNFNGDDTFTYHASDGTASSATVTVTITVGPLPDGPVAVDDAFATDEDTSLNITAPGVLNNDSDPENDPLQVTAFDAVSTQGATVSVAADGSFIYDPTGAANLQALAAGAMLDDTFTYTVEDNPSTGSDVGTVTVTVTGVDDPPTAVNDTATVTEDDPATAIDVLFNDTDTDGGAKLVTGVTQPANGTVAITGGGTGLTYQPGLDYCNDPPGTVTDDFTYTITGGSMATVMVTVTCVNDPPVALDDAYTTVGNTELTGGGATPTSLARVVDATNPLGNDSDPVEGTALTVVAAAGDLTGPPFVGTSALGGDVTMNADGSFVYVPPVGIKNRLGGSADTFSYTVQDAGGAQATATVAIEIVDEIVWYLHNDPAGEALNPAGGDGRSNDPFDKLSDADAVADDPEDASAPGDTIFVFRGDGTTANQSLGITLTSGQKLLGHRAATLLRGGVTIQTPGNGAHPKIEHTAADGVTVLANAGNGDRAGIEIRGLDITGDDNAIDVAAGDANNLDIALTDNLLTSTNGASLVVDGSGSTGNAVVRELSATNVLTAGAGGGHVFESVTFDADVVAAGIQPVAAGNVAVGNPASPGDVTGHGVRLNNVRGILDFGTLNVGNSGGVGLFVRDADGKAGTFVLDTDGGTISTVNGPALDLDPVGLGLGGMDGMVLTSVTVSVNAGVVPHGILLDTVAGSFQVTGATSISAGGIGTLTTGINAINATAAITFTGTTTISNTTGAGIGMTNVDGPFTVASMTSSITGAGGAAIDIDQGLGDVTYNGSITNTAGRSVEITNHEGPGGGSTVSLAGAITDSGLGIFLDNNDQGAGGSVVNLTGALNLTTGGSNAFSAINGGIVNVTDPANNNLAATTTGTGVTIADTSIGASGVKFTTVNVGDANPVAPNAASGILLTNVPSGNFTVSGGAIQNVTDRGLDVQGGSGNVTVGTSISTTTTGRSLEVTGKMGGTVAVSGAIDDNGLGVRLDSNAGSTVTVTGSMNIDTVGANTGFNATGGGTVNVLTGTNDVDTSAGAGIAVNIANTTIGASGVTFRSVSADGATIGIHLDNAGTSGFFTVTGTGSTAGSGGTIQNTTQNGVLVQSTDHINLSNLNLFNASNDGGGAGSCSATVFTGCNAAVELATVVDVNLVNLAITGAEDHGIFGQTVTDLDISNTTVTGLGADVDTNEHGIFLRDLLGTVAGTTDSVFDAVAVDDAQDTAILIQNAIATNPGNTLSPDQLTVSNSVLTDAGDSGLNVQTVAAGGNLRLVATGNTVTNTVDGIDAEASAGNLQASVGGAGPLTNVISAGAGGNMVNGILFFASAAGGPAVVDATATNNLITLDAVKVGMPPVAPVSGLNGIGVSASGASAANLGTIRATVQGNMINSSFSGILTQTVHGVITTNEGTGTTSQNVITIDGNVITLDPPAGTTTAETVGIGVDGGTTGAGTTVRSTNNTIVATGDASNGASVGIQILPTELGDPAGTGTRVCVRVTGNDVSTPNNLFAAAFLTTELDVIAAPVVTGSFLDVEAIPVGARTTAQLKADLEPLNTNTEVGDPGAAVTGTITGVMACPN